MAVIPSKQRRLLGLPKTSNSTTGLAVSPGPSQARAGHFTATSEIASMVPRISLLHGPVGKLRNNRNSFQQFWISTLSQQVTERESNNANPTQFQPSSLKIQNPRRHPLVRVSMPRYKNSTAFASSRGFKFERYVSQSFQTFQRSGFHLASVHPNAQAALGILTVAFQLLVNQVNLDHTLLDKVQSIHE
ncbi:hypothetical protein EDC04DRAFT_115147 [Pisolithus marmoratus]|nr:hypothetical protein EDC04DRAFT_115147 [Pisolithus marmoratus]